MPAAEGEGLMLASSQSSDRIVKTCSTCGRTFTRDQFLAAPPPANGRTVTAGRRWRLCPLPCTNTLALPVIDLAEPVE